MTAIDSFFMSCNPPFGCEKWVVSKSAVSVTVSVTTSAARQI